MTKIAFALAAAVLGCTTMTNVANAGVRLGFGFPLGSFVARSHESYSADDYRPSYRPRSVRRDYHDDAPARKIAKAKRAPKTEVANAPAKARPAPAVQTAKLDDKPSSDPATTTVIEKTPDTSSKTPVSKDVTTGSITPAPATTEKTQSSAKSDKEPAAVEAKHVCRRYSPAIAGLVDVPCE
ncbi:hypothetical protein [Hyphomicrobium sp.]|uniref:hypothetical protein n=1 Tax=Hyphomicrobium sp. TaxID=82 RepID=UPI002D777DC5|nr:hypothetical protein [Hyphomicrobium sp.]HET6389134.1 hypothetical protein [Hyphomicrobium sp.]